MVPAARGVTVLADHALRVGDDLAGCSAVATCEGGGATCNRYGYTSIGERRDSVICQYLYYKRNTRCNAGHSTGGWGAQDLHHIRPGNRDEVHRLTDYAVRCGDGDGTGGPCDSQLEGIAVAVSLPAERKGAPIAEAERAACDSEQDRVANHRGESSRPHHLHLEVDGIAYKYGWRGLLQNCHRLADSDCCKRRGHGIGCVDCVQRDQPGTPGSDRGCDHSIAVGLHPACLAGWACIQPDGANLARQ